MNFGKDSYNYKELYLCNDIETLVIFIRISYNYS